MGVLHITKENNCKIALWEITETLEELLQLYPTISTPDFNTEKRKKEWLASRLLLNKISPDIRISYNEVGAPKLNNDNYISISHSKGLVAITISQQQVGIDIEEISDKALRVSSKFISKNNLNDLTANKATLIWCCKEAIYKWHQQGNIDLVKDIIIQPFLIEEKGEIKAQFKNAFLTLFYTKINSHFLVYVCN